ncbi:ABC transporter substrate-binding protein [Marinobacter bryozoorum]|uniref:MlaC/ttg2D family ABC transporter substrate-binding protein n=1 Tax=Marinobacter bryozoorum TaxID=256324 RepID=UPI002006B5AA|nr:ABC transporter substrate-binding protein [Marinobacter bryozoorum]MCK7546101.1 ABC transporter substrate-binding protein [Marinobacter bryozoorum]
MTAVRYTARYTPLTVAFFIVALLAALSARPAAASSKDLARYVDENTQALVDRLNEEKDLYEEDPEAFFGEMEEALTGFVDFRRIAARVMGRYARQTTTEQRDEFVVRFKRSLFESYATALVNNSDGFSIDVQQAEINPRNEDRASVNLLVTTDSGNRYQVTYSMYRKDGDSAWLMENVIVEGVNIGLAFRDRFAQEMEARRGNVDDVISNWGDAVASLNLDEEMEQGADE